MAGKLALTYIIVGQNETDKTTMALLAVSVWSIIMQLTYISFREYFLQ